MKRMKGTGLVKGMTAFAGLAAAAVLSTAGSSEAGSPGTPDNYSNLPNSVQLLATIRDFRAKGDGGHADFESFSGSTTVGLVQETLDSSNKPLVKSLRGKTISTEYKDSKGRAINPALYNKSVGDVAGTLTTGGTGNGLSSEAAFAQWYRDVPGVNVSKTVPLVLNRVVNTNRYVFDSATDEPYKTRGGFFPIDGELFGNYSYNNRAHNFHFTTELEANFTYEKNTGQVFKFTGDDDVWVFINGKLVVDLGGLHSKKEQYLDLDRLSWLESGKDYSFKIFHAERHTTESNFRMETTLKFRAVDPPATTALFD